MIDFDNFLIVVSLAFVVILVFVPALLILKSLKKKKQLEDLFPMELLQDGEYKRSKMSIQEDIDFFESEFQPQSPVTVFLSSEGVDGDGSLMDDDPNTPFNEEKLTAH